MSSLVALRIGTRGSPLALIQAEATRDALAAAHPDLKGRIEIVVIRTTGDRVRDRALAEIGGKGLFTKEIEDGLLDHGIDIAVHSMKDMPTELPPGLAIPCLLPRADPRDALLASGAGSIADLARGAVVGTASLRRKAQLLARRPDIEVVLLCGNVETRLAKLRAGTVDATLLALAGLDRLGLTASSGAVPIASDEMLPAVAQGAIGIEARADDDRVAALLAPINHRPTATAVAAERAFLAQLDGSCRTPIAALAEIDGNDLSLRGLIAKPDGSAVRTIARQGAVVDAVAIGAEAGRELGDAVGPDFLAALG